MHWRLRNKSDSVDCDGGHAPVAASRHEVQMNSLSEHVGELQVCKLWKAPDLDCSILGLVLVMFQYSCLGVLTGCTIVSAYAV